MIPAPPDRPICKTWRDPDSTQTLAKIARQALKRLLLAAFQPQRLGFHGADKPGVLEPGLQPLSQTGQGGCIEPGSIHMGKLAHKREDGEVRRAHTPEQHGLLLQPLSLSQSLLQWQQVLERLFEIALLAELRITVKVFVSVQQRLECPVIGCNQG